MRSICTSSFRLLFLGGALLSVMTFPALAQTVTVGDPQHPADLAGALDQAYQQGSRDLTIAPGVYDLPVATPQNRADAMPLDHWSDVTVRATGVTLIFEDVNRRPIHLNQCKNVTWDGGIYLFAHPSFTQGRVTALHSDPLGGSCDWQIDAGYPTNIKPLKSTYDVVDQTTRLLKVGTGDWAPESAESTGPGLFRFHYSAGRASKFAVGDWLVTRAPGGSTIFHFDGCQTCTLKNVTLQNAGFAAFFETGGAGANRFLNCKLQPGPRPPGATEDELVGCGADGFHSTGTGIGPDIEDCVFTGVFLDDCIAIHGSFDRVVGAEGADITLASTRASPAVGDPLRIADMKGFFAQATCTAVSTKLDGKMQLTLDSDLQVPIDHAEDFDPRKGTKASDPMKCGHGYKILRCRLGDTRSRGILVKADDGLIQGCKIEGCGMSGVSIGPEFWWNEAGYSWNVTVSDNAFLNCNKNNARQAAVWIHGDGAIGNRNITIKNNSFDTCYGDYIILAEWTDGVQITNNKIKQPSTIKSDSPGHVVWINQSKNVTLLGNTVTDPGPYAGDLVGLDPSVSPAEVHNNDSTGIQAAAGPNSPPNALGQ